MWSLVLEGPVGGLKDGHRVSRQVNGRLVLYAAAQGGRLFADTDSSS